MIIFGVLCLPFVMRLFLINLDSRLLCLVRLVAWACVRYLGLLQQPFWVVVLVLLPFALSFCLPFRGILLPCLLFLVRSLLSFICLLHFLVLQCQKCLPLSYLRFNGYFNLSLMLVSPILCCPLAHFVIKLGFVPSLHTLVPVHGSGPFLQFLWALPCPGRSLCVLFGTGLEFQFSLLPILFAAPAVARWTSLETIFLAGGHGSMRIRRHDALCDVIFHALL